MDVNFILQKLCQCKKNDNYKVCCKHPVMSWNIYHIKWGGHIWPFLDVLMPQRFLLPKFSGLFPKSGWVVPPNPKMGKNWIWRDRLILTGKNKDFGGAKKKRFRGDYDLKFEGTKLAGAPYFHFHLSSLLICNPHGFSLT